MVANHWMLGSSYIHRAKAHDTRAASDTTFNATIYLTLANKQFPESLHSPVNLSGHHMMHKYQQQH